MGTIGFKIAHHTEDSYLSEEELAQYELEEKTSELIAFIERVCHTEAGLHNENLISKAYAILENEAVQQGIPESGVAAVGMGLIKNTQSFTRDGLISELDRLISQHEHLGLVE